MKFKSALTEKVSGSIGTLAGAQGSGGNHFRRKILKQPKPSPDKIITNDRMNLANQAWHGMTEETRQGWGEYGKTLLKENQTNHKSHDTGWQAFAKTFLMMLNSNMDPTQILLNRPPIDGYLEPVEYRTLFIPPRWYFYIDTVGTYGLSSFKSQSFKNTINKNTKPYNFYKHFEHTWPDRFQTQINSNSGRYFVNNQIININGNISKPSLYTLDS